MPSKGLRGHAAVQGTEAMRSLVFMGKIFPILFLSSCAMFGSAPVYGDIPQCERLIPQSLKGSVEGVPIPNAEFYSDGHEKAQPWEEAFLGQSGQLDKANERPAAVDHIYSECLAMHREALK